MNRVPDGLALLLAIPLLLVGCEAPEAETDTDAEPAAESAMEPAAEAPVVDVAAVEQAIRDREDEWERAAMTSVDAFAAFYTADGVLMAPNAAPARGPAAVAAAMGPMFEMVDSIAFDPVSVEVAASGEMAVEQGRYTLTGTMPDGTPFDDEGSYLVVWTNQGGQWMVTHDIFNTDRPAEEAGSGEM
jgi:ketosteroid isomerase-like protein